MPLDIKDTLRHLTHTRGPSGQEAAIAAEVQALMTPLCDDVSIDHLYNVVGFKRGTGPEPRPRLALMAHMDEIFLLVTALDGPFLRFTDSALYDARVLVGQEVEVLGRQILYGIIGDRPPHLMSVNERRRMPGESELVIDVGLDAETLAQNVRVGDVVLVRSPFVELLSERVAGKAFDNRISVTTLLATLDRLQDLRHPCDIYAIANVGEEINLLGGTTMAHRLQPDAAIVLDATFGKQPGAPDGHSFELDDGPVISIGPNLHPCLVEKLIDIASELELDYSLEPLPGYSGTDAWAVQVAGAGVPAALLGVPIRNMHSQGEIVDLRDVGRLVRWLTAFVGAFDAACLESLSYRLPAEVTT